MFVAGCKTKHTVINSIKCKLYTLNCTLLFYNEENHKTGQGCFVSSWQRSAVFRIHEEELNKNWLKTSGAYIKIIKY